MYQIEVQIKEHNVDRLRELLYHVTNIPKKQSGRILEMIWMLSDIAPSSWNDDLALQERDVFWWMSRPLIPIDAGIFLLMFG